MKPIVFAVFIFVASSVFAQDYKTTLRWMHNTARYKGSGYHIGDKTIMDETEVPLSNRCQSFSVIQTTHYQTQKSTPDSVWEVSTNLAAIDPQTIVVNAVKGEGDKEGKTWAYVWMETTNDEDAIKTQRSGMEAEEATSGVAFFFNDPDYARRFAKALKHAVTLCGGTKSSRH
jgi:hypothetical protein